MTSTETGRNLSVRKVWRAREERRRMTAEELRDSTPVYALMQNLSTIDPDAIVTVTEPKGHPFARIKVRATWGVSEDHPFATNEIDNGAVPIWKGNQVQISVARSVFRGHERIKIRSGEGTRILSEYVDPEMVIRDVQEAIAKPSRVVFFLRPGSEKHEKVI